MKLKKTLLSQSFNPWSYPFVSFILLTFLLLSCLYWQGDGAFLTASREQIFQQHEYWKLFTTIAVHGDVKHFLGNATFLLIFGFLLHSYFGVLWFPFLSVMMGAFVNYFTLALYPAHTVLLGASGVVYFMAGAWATLFFFIERKSHPLKRAVAAIGVSLMLFFPSSYEPEVSYLAHSLGFMTGVTSASAYFYFAKERIQSAEVWEAQTPEEFSDFFYDVS